MRKPQPTEAEFDVLRQRRDEQMNIVIRGVALSLGLDPDNVHGHISQAGNTPQCYCACPDGPCQHDWTGPSILILDDRDEPCGSERTCRRCGLGAMAHDLRVMP